MYVKWLRRSPFYAVKCMLLLQLISRTTGAGCSVDHGSGMNYPTTTASGTWTTRGGISSYGWDSRQPIDPCSRCTNTPPPLPGSQYTTHIHDNNYNPNDRISSISGFMTDNRGSGYGTDNRGSGYVLNNQNTVYGSDNHGSSYNSNSDRGNVYYGGNNRPIQANYNLNGQIGSGGYISGTNYGGNNKFRNPDYRGNGYDNLSPEWERRHNKKGTGGVGGSVTVGGGGGYYQGMSNPVSNVPDGQGVHMQVNYHQKPSNDRWSIKGAHPVKIDSGYWHSQPPKDIGWDEDSKKVGVIAGWIGGPKKFESSKPSQTYGFNQANDKNDDYFHKGTGYDDQKKPYMGWGGSGSYEVVKMNSGYKYIDRNSNSDYGIANHGNNYGYGGQSYNYNNKPTQDYGIKPTYVEHSNKPHDHSTSNYDKFSAYDNGNPTKDYNKPYMHGYNKSPPSQGYNKPTIDYGSRPSMGWSTPSPIGYEVTSSRPPMWGSQRPGYPVVASRPTQHWGENSFSNPGVNEFSRPVGYESSRPGDTGSSRPGDYGFSRPGADYGSLTPDGYGSSKPDGYGSSRPEVYGVSRPTIPGLQSGNDGGGRPDYGSVRPFVESIHQSTINMASDYGSQRPDFEKFSGYSDNSGFGGRPHQTNDRPSYDNERPFMNGNDVYGSQQQTGSGYGKGYASNWDYYSNSMRGSSSYASAGGGWNDQNRDYSQRRPDSDALQSGSNFRPSESTPLHYNGHSGIGASTDNGFLYKNPSTIVGSSTTPMPTTTS